MTKAEISRFEIDALWNSTERDLDLALCSEASRNPGKLHLLADDVRRGFCTF